MANSTKKNEANLYIPQKELKHITFAVGDIVVLNSKAIDFLYIGKYKISENIKYDDYNLNDFLFMKIIPSKSLENLRNKKNVGARNSTKANAQEVIYFLEQKGISSLFLSYDREIREAFDMKHSLFIPIDKTENTAYALGNPTSENMLTNDMSAYFKETRTTNKQKTNPADILVGKSLFEHGGYICLPNQDYSNSSPDCIRGTILFMWQKNKVIDMTDDRKAWQAKKFNPKSLMNYKAINSKDMTNIIQTPLNMLIACVEWVGHPYNFIMNIPLYVLMPYNIIPKNTS